MTRVLLTGASGFIATHILDILLAHNHSVRITVRSQSKADALISAHPSKAHLIDPFIIPDISVPGAFDEAVKSSPPFTAVLHTASPFHFNITNSIKTDLLDPAINGTTSVLEAVYKFAPEVETVVITSSFAAIVDAKIGLAPEKVYSEEDWNPVTSEEAEKDPSTGYRASKTFAEKAAWKFVEEKKPNFKIATINPPLVFGPVKPYIHSLESLNTSNQNIYNLLTPKAREILTGPNPPMYLWVDVRDVAAAHVAAFEKPDAPGQRFFVAAGKYTATIAADVIRNSFPEYAVNFPEERKEFDGYPGPKKEDEIYGINTSRSRQVLGIQYKTFEESIVDTVRSLKELGA